MLDVRKISWDKLSEIFLRDRLQIFTERKNEKCRLLSPLSAIPVLYIYLHFNPIWQITQSRLLLILWLEHQRIFSPHEERRGSFTTQKIRIWYYWKDCRCWESSFLSSLIIVFGYQTTCETTQAQCEGGGRELDTNSSDDAFCCYILPASLRYIQMDFSTENKK